MGQTNQNKQNNFKTLYLELVFKKNNEEGPLKGYKDFNSADDKDNMI